MNLVIVILVIVVLLIFFMNCQNVQLSTDKAYIESFTIKCTPGLTPKQLCPVDLKPCPSNGICGSSQTPGGVKPTTTTLVPNDDGGDNKTDTPTDSNIGGDGKTDTPTGSNIGGDGKTNTPTNQPLSPNSDGNKIDISTLPTLNPNEVAIIFINRFSEPKKLFFRWAVGEGITVNGKKALQAGNNCLSGAGLDKTCKGTKCCSFNKCPSGFACLQQFDNETTLMPGKRAIVKIPANSSMTGGAAWLGLPSVPSWRDSSQSPEDNLCSLIEWTLDLKDLYYDISAVEGLCGGYKISWFPNNKESPKPKFTNISCKVPGSGNLGSDKQDFYRNHINSKEQCTKHTSSSTIKECLAACPYPADKEVHTGPGPATETPQTRLDKIACHNWYETNSYTKGGYCQKLFDADCQGYCWAYDEMMCPENKTCTYDRNGNPILPDGQKSYDPMDHSKSDNNAWKKVLEARTTPTVPRKMGSLVVEFYPRI